MIKLLFLDDERSYIHPDLAQTGEAFIYLKAYAPDEVKVVRSYKEAVAYVMEHGLPEAISLDNDIQSYDDLGEEKKGYDFAKLLCELMLDGKIVTPYHLVYNAHSANTQDGPKIESYLANFAKHLNLAWVKYE